MMSTILLASASALQPRCVPPRASVWLSAIEPMQESAEAQRAGYFDLMPSRSLPKFSFDTRLLASTADDACEAGVFVRQEPAVPQWRNVGSIAAAEEALFSAAVAKQRALIERWAYEACNDFETNELVMDLEAPMELAWSVEPAKPSFFDSLQGVKPADPVFSAVPADAEFDEDLRCGFLGVLAREYRGGGVSARYERIVIGQEPETPLRSESQEKYNKKYAYYKKSKRGQNKGQIIV